MSNTQTPRTILTADSESASRAQLCRAFSGAYAVLEAQDGLDALALLRSEREIAAVVLRLNLPKLDGFGVLKAMGADPRLRAIPVVAISDCADENIQLRALKLGAVDVICQPFNLTALYRRVCNLIEGREADRLAAENRILERLLRQSEIDQVTGIYNKAAFCRRAAELIRSNPEQRYVICRWDIDRFKVYNDMFGVEAGDRFLAKVGEFYRRTAKAEGILLYGHLSADHFVACYTCRDFSEKNIIKRLQKAMAELGEAFEFVPRLGVYRVDDPTLDVSLMCDRALLALRSIKYRYAQRMAWYDESMRAALLEEQALIGDMQTALTDGQFVVYYQPQYNYAENTLYGAEALVRWQHPKMGLIPPGRFIAAFERNGFINRLDEYVWETACAHLRGWMDRGLPVMPVSINISRIDIYGVRLCEHFVELVQKYALEPHMLRLEITESAYMENPEQLIKTVQQLRDAGFTVEMDDFGSGYSSLNTLKDVPVNILKMDMNFLKSARDDGKSGRILYSVVRMANWINLTVIAEGVETKEQADYLKSIGCLFMQGYYFAAPMDEGAFGRLLASKPHFQAAEQGPDKSIVGAVDFLNASTQATLLFNSFVGGAQIVSFDGKRAEALRINDRFYEVVNTTPEKYARWRENLLERFTPASQLLYKKALQTARRTGKEASCELECNPLFPGEAPLWSFHRIRFLARDGNLALYYVSIENITERKELEQTRKRLDAIVKNVPAGIAIYEWQEGFAPKYLSQNALTLFGYTREERERVLASGTPIGFMPELSSLPEDTVNRFYAGEPMDVTFPAARRDGSRFWIRIVASMVKPQEGAAQVYATFTDVTMRMQSADDLRIQRQKMDFALRNSRLMLLEYNIRDKTLVKLGGPPTQYLPSVIRNVPDSLLHSGIIEPESLSACQTLLEDLLTRRDIVSRDLKLRVGQRTAWWRITFQTLLSEGVPSGAIGSAEDITDETWARAERLSLEQNLAVAGTVICYVDIPKRTLTMPESYASLFGLEPVIENLPDSFLPVVAGDLTACRAFFDQMFAGVPTGSVTLQYDMPDGATRWDRGTYTTRFDESGNPVSAVLTVKDETAQHLQRIENERNRLIMSSSGISIFDYDVKKDVLHFEAEQAGRGVVHKDLTHYLTFLFAPENTVHPEFRNLIRDAIDAGRESPRSGTLECRTNTWGAGYRWSRIHYVSLADDRGQVYRIVGQISDIQEEKEKEALLKSMNRGGSAPATFDPVVLTRVFGEIAETTNASAAIDRVLALMGSYFQVSRVFVFEDSPDHQFASNTYEWCAPGVSPEKEHLQRLSYARTFGSNFGKVFDENGLFVCGDINTMEADQRDFLAAQGIQSMLLSAIMRDGVFFGFVGFDECRQKRCWTGEQTGTLSILGRIVGLLLAQKHARLGAAFSEDFMAAMEDSASLIQVVEPETFRVVYHNRQTRRRFGLPNEPWVCYKAMMGREEPCPNCPIHKLYETGQSMPSEMMLPDGDWLLSQAAPIRWNGREMYMVTCTDITAQKNAEAELNLLLEEYRIVVKQSGKSVILHDLRTRLSIRYLAADETAAPIRQENMPDSVLEKDLVAPESRDTYRAFYDAMYREEPTGKADVLMRLAPDAELRWVHLDYTLVNGADGRPAVSVISMFDNTEQMERDRAYAEWQARIHALMIKGMPYLEVNLTTCQVEQTENIQLQPGDKDGLNAYVSYGLKHLVAAEDQSVYRQFFDRERLLGLYYAGQGEDHLEYRATEEGRVQWFRVDVQLIASPFSQDVKALIVHTNIDREVRQREALAASATRDSMTGLLNRAAMEQQVTAILEKAGHGEPFAMFMIDLDDLKGINDNLGHLKGDAAILHAAEAIRKAFRTGDLAGRVGGDEFMVFLRGATPGAVRSKAEQLKMLLQFRLEDRPITGSIGAVVTTGGEAGFTRLYSLADRALYMTKRNGKAGYTLLDGSGMPLAE